MRTSRPTCSSFCDLRAGRCVPVRPGRRGASVPSASARGGQAVPAPVDGDDAGRAERVVDATSERGEVRLDVVSAARLRFVGPCGALREGGVVDDRALRCDEHLEEAVLRGRQRDRLAKAHDRLCLRDESQGGARGRHRRALHRPVSICGCVAMRSTLADNTCAELSAA